MQGRRDAAPFLLGPNFFVFMQFSAKIDQIIGGTSPTGRHSCSFYVPVKPGGQTQMKPSIRSAQLAPFSQGKLSHSTVAVSQNTPATISSIQQGFHYISFQTNTNHSSRSYRLNFILIKCIQICQGAI